MYKSTPAKVEVHDKGEIVGIYDSNGYVYKYNYIDGKLEKLKADDLYAYADRSALKAAVLDTIKKKFSVPNKSDSDFTKVRILKDTLPKMKTYMSKIKNPTLNIVFGYIYNDYCWMYKDSNENLKVSADLIKIEIKAANDLYEIK